MELNSTYDTWPGHLHGSRSRHCAAFLPCLHGMRHCLMFFRSWQKTAWEVWKSFPEITTTCVQLSTEPDSLDSHFSQLQRFVVLMYDRSSNKTSVNLLRKHLFTKKGRTMEALYLHQKQPCCNMLSLHAVYQGGYCWYRSLRAQQHLPSPSEWGWQMDEDGMWRPSWTTLPDIAQFGPELLKCGCKKGCGKRCICYKAKTKCTALCQCDGDCNDLRD